MSVFRAWKWKCHRIQARKKNHTPANVRQPFHIYLCMINNFSSTSVSETEHIYFGNSTITNKQPEHKALTYRKFNIIIYGTKMKCHQLCWCNLNKLCYYIIFMVEKWNSEVERIWWCQRNVIWSSNKESDSQSVGKRVTWPTLASQRCNLV